MVLIFILCLSYCDPPWVPKEKDGIEINKQTNKRGPENNQSMWKNQGETQVSPVEISGMYWTQIAESELKPHIVAKLF